MKISEAFKKIISSVLLVAVFSVSNFSLYTQKVGAQVSGNASGNVNGGFNLQGIGAVAAGCATSFFVARKAAKKAALLKEKVEDAAVDGAGSAVGSLTGVDPTDIEDGNTPSPEVPVVDNNVPSAIKVEVLKVNTETTLQSFKEECLDLLARYAVLKIMDKITLMTVEWINSGFEGNPFYPENRPNFFEQIAKEEVGKATCIFMGGDCSNPDPLNFPFGRIISETILLTVQNRLQDNLRFSLNQVLQSNNQYANYESFTARFSVGGWAGYTAFAQPNNNVFGNYLMAQNHLARQTAGTNINITKNFQQELNEAGGLLNQRICRLTETGDPADEYFERGDSMHMGDYNLMGPTGVVSDIIELLPLAVQEELSDVQGDSAQREMYNYFVKRSKCAQWETVTPGRFIAEQTSQVLGGPFRSLELSDEFNENLGLIFDALAAQLFEQGLRSFERTDRDYSLDPNDPNYNALWAQTNNPDFGSSRNQPTTGQFIQGTGSGTGTDPGLSLLEIQQTYLLQASIAIQNLTTLIRDIRALDYCIPGPNPRWYDVGSVNLQNNISTTVSPGGDGAYYADAVQQLTGITVSESAVPNLSQFNAFINFVLVKYRDEVFANYSPLLPPPQMRSIATNYFSQVEGYQSQLEVIQSQVNALIPIIPQIQAIESQYESLTEEQQQNPNSPEMQTITSLLTQISSQGALASQEQLNQINAGIGTYGSQISAVNQYISQCISEVSGSAYQGLEERVQYPFISVFENSLINQPSLTPNVNRYLSNINFGDSDSEINLSGFNDLNLSIPTVSTETFTGLLQSLY